MGQLRRISGRNPTQPHLNGERGHRGYLLNSGLPHQKKQLPGKSKVITFRNPKRNMESRETHQANMFPFAGRVVVRNPPGRGKRKRNGGGRGRVAVAVASRGLCRRLEPGAARATSGHHRCGVHRRRRWGQRLPGGECGGGVSRIAARLRVARGFCRLDPPKIRGLCFFFCFPSNPPPNKKKMHPQKNTDQDANPGSK